MLSLLPLQPRVAEIKSTLEARGAQIKKLRSKVDNVEDEVRGHHSSWHICIVAELQCRCHSGKAKEDHAHF